MSDEKFKLPEPKLPTTATELKLSANSSIKTSDESLDLKVASSPNELSKGGGGGGEAVKVWLKAVTEIARLVGDAAQSFEDISGDGVSTKHAITYTCP